MYEMIFVFAIAAFFGLLTLFANREEALKKEAYNQMANDHLQTCNAIMFCTRNDAERLIDSFYGRWSGVIDEWELSTRTAALYKRVRDTQKTREEMVRRQNGYRNQ
jgi:hypothetical protein